MAVPESVKELLHGRLSEELSSRASDGADVYVVEGFVEAEGRTYIENLLIDLHIFNICV